ncbi:hypothetical protein [Streptomyces mirabilis]
MRLGELQPAGGRRVPPHAGGAAATASASGKDGIANRKDAQERAAAYGGLLLRPRLFRLRRVSRGEYETGLYDHQQAFRLRWRHLDRSNYLRQAHYDAFRT